MKTIVIGGGLSGLSAAYRLSEKGYEVTVLEKENFLGGLASSYHLQLNRRKYWITKAYHHILHGDDATVNIIKELELENKLRKNKMKIGFLYKKRIYGFSSILELLKFPLPLYDKIRLARFVQRMSKRKDWNNATHFSAKEWIINEVGKKNFEVFFEPLIRNKFNEPAKKIPASWFIKRFAKESKSFSKQTMWLEGGIEQIIDLLVKNIKRNGGKIKLNVEINKIINAKEKKVEYLVNKEKCEESADIILSTIPPETFLKLVDKIPTKIKKKLQKIKYLSCISACIGLKGSPTDICWINILDRNLPFDAIFNKTILYEDSTPSGSRVIYLFTYLRPEDELWNIDEKEIFQIYANNFNKIFPGFGKKIEWYKISKFKHAQVLYNLNFKNPPVSTDGIYFAGIYRIYPKIRSMASAIESGFEASDKIINDRIKRAHATKEE